MARSRLSFFKRGQGDNVEETASEPEQQGGSDPTQQKADAEPRAQGNGPAPFDQSESGEQAAKKPPPPARRAASSKAASDDDTAEWVPATGPPAGAAAPPEPDSPGLERPKPVAKPALAPSPPASEAPVRAATRGDTAERIR